MHTRILLLTLLAFSSFVPVASAHAIILSASPEANTTVRGPSVELTLRYNSRIDVKRSTLVLILPGGVERSLTAAQPSPNIVKSVGEGLAPGAYVLRWQVLAEDGHITRGELPFRVE